MIWDRHTEFAVLCAILRNPQRHLKHLGWLGREHFADERHRLIIGALRRVEAEHGQEAVEYHAVLFTLRDDMGRAGGIDYLQSMTGGIDLEPASLEVHARRLREFAAKRLLFQSIEELKAAALDMDSNPLQATRAITERVREAVDGLEIGRGSVSAADLALNLQGYLEGEHEPGMLLGFPGLDRFLDLRPGNFCLVGARPRVGKSCFALQAALNVARRGERVWVGNLEMCSQDIGLRLLSNLQRIPHENLRRPRLMSEPQMKAAAKGLYALHRLPITFSEVSRGQLTGTLDNFLHQARIEHDRHGLSLVIVDYLQLLTMPGHRDSREGVVREISRSLKLLAGELKLPILCLVQLNRKLEDRSDPRPRLSDVRESGSLEQDADSVLFIYRDELHFPPGERRPPGAPDEPEGGWLPSEAQVHVAKNRGGDIGMARFIWRGQFQSFDTPAFSDTPMEAIRHG